MFITTTLVLVGITVLSFAWLLIKAKTRNVKKTNLPSPPRHWLLGHILVFNSLDSRPMLAFHQLKRSLGSLFHLDMLKSQMVFVGGYPELKEILNGENCECRKSTPIGQDLVYGMKNTGILMNPSPDYKELRRFSLKCLRDLGLGKHKSEAIILEESKCLNEEVKKRMKKNSGKFLQEDLERLFAKSSLNIIWNFVSAERFEYDDKMAEKLLYFSDCFTKLGKEILGKPLGIFPFLKHIPPFRSKYQEVENGFRELRQFIRTSISNHEDTLDINNPRDYIDMFLIESKETKNPILTKDNLMAICLDLFIAGSETTSNVIIIYFLATRYFKLYTFQSLLWDLAFMINHQDVQDAVRDELDEAAGDSMITLRHKDDIPLTEATINEVWRMGNVGGITPPRNIKVKTKRF